MKKIIGTVALAAGVFGLAACSAPEEPEMNAPETEAPAPTEEQAPAPEAPETEAEDSDTAGPAVVTSPSDGTFHYEVREVSDTQTHFYDAWEDPYFPDQDVFFIATITATNKSSYPATAPDPWMLDHLVAIDSEGRAYQADDEPWTDTFDLNPGATASYDVAWDLPRGVDIEYVEIASRDSYNVAVLEVE